jgi:hypothetical protein
MAASLTLFLHARFSHCPEQFPSLPEGRGKILSQRMFAEGQQVRDSSNQISGAETAARRPSASRRVSLQTVKPS